MEDTSLQIVSLANIFGVLRWIVFSLLIVLTFYCIHRHSKSERSRSGFWMLLITVISAPFLLLEIVTTQPIIVSQNTKEEASIDDGEPIPSSDELPDEHGAAEPEAEVSPDEAQTNDWAPGTVIRPDRSEPHNESPEEQPTPPDHEESGDEEEPDPVEPDDPVATYYTITISDASVINPADLTEYKEGELIKIRADEREGYTFSHWQCDHQVADGQTNNPLSFAMPAASLTIKAIFVANTDTPYLVRHHYLNLGGSSYEEVVETLAGTTGESVTPAIKAKTGFVSPEPQQLTIAADGGSVLTYTYQREKYNLTLKSSEYIETEFASGEYEYGTEISLEAKEREDYRFLRWDNGETSKRLVFTMQSDVTLEPIYKKTVANLTYHFGSHNFNGKSILITDVPLFSETTKDDDFRLSFHTDRFTPLASQDSNFNSIVNSIDESGSPWPGFVYRYNTKSSKYDFTINIDQKTRVERKYDNVDEDTLIERNSGALSYNGDMIGDFSAFTNTFETPLTIGASLNKELKPYRYTDCALSNIDLIYKYSADSNVSLPKPSLTRAIFVGWNTKADGTGTYYSGYDDFELLDDTELYAIWAKDDEFFAPDYTVTYDFGDLEFDGASYLDTRFLPFMDNDRYHNFELSFTIDDYEYLPGQDENLNTIMSAMDETKSPYPGIVFRRSRYPDQGYEFVANDDKNRKNMDPQQYTDVIISRISDHAYINGTDFRDLFGLEKPFDFSMVIGSSLNGVKEPYRYFKGKLSNVKLKVSYIKKDTVFLPKPTMTGKSFAGWTGSNGDTPQMDITINRGNTVDKYYTANFN